MPPNPYLNFGAGSGSPLPPQECCNTPEHRLVVSPMGAGKRYSDGSGSGKIDIGYSPPARKNRNVASDAGMGHSKSLTATGSQTVALQLPAAVAVNNAALECSTLETAASQCSGLQPAGLQCRTLQTTASHCGTLQTAALQCRTRQTVGLHWGTLQTTHENKLTMDGVREPGMGEWERAN